MVIVYMISVITYLTIFGVVFSNAIKYNVHIHNRKYEPQETQEKCCVTCTLPKMKYYYIDTNDHTCSETCLTSKQYTIFKYMFPVLKQDNKSTLPCERYDYHVVNGTVQKGKCPICTQFDVYNKDYYPELTLEYLR